SMGGATVIDVALEHPEIVTALVVIGAGVSGFTRWADQSMAHFGALMQLVQKGDINTARERDAHYWIDGPRRDPARVNPVYRDRARQLHADNFDPKRFLNREDELQPPAIGRLGEIRCPTLVVIGTEDADDLHTLANRFATEIPNARKVTIADAAHLPSLE